MRSHALSAVEDVVCDAMRDRTGSWRERRGDDRGDGRGDDVIALLRGWGVGSSRGRAVGVSKGMTRACRALLSSLSAWWSSAQPQATNSRKS